MAAVFNPPWATGAGALITEPPTAVKSSGFSCGPADVEHFNWLHNQYQLCINDLLARIAVLENTAGTGLGTGTIVPVATSGGTTNNLGTGTIV